MPKGAKKIAVRLTVNGKERQEDVEPRFLLVHIHASALYRAHLTKVYTQKALEKALSR
jgi:hypothetical protein